MVGAGTDTYSLGSNDNAIDTVVEAGSAVTKDGTTSAISGFDLINQFTKTQDVLNFNNGTGKQLAGTYTAGRTWNVHRFHYRQRRHCLQRHQQQRRGEHHRSGGGADRLGC